MCLCLALLGRNFSLSYSMLSTIFRCLRKLWIHYTFKRHVLPKKDLLFNIIHNCWKAITNAIHCFVMFWHVSLNFIENEKNTTFMVSVCSFEIKLIFVLPIIKLFTILGSKSDNKKLYSTDFNLFHRFLGKLWWLLTKFWSPN